MRLRITFAKTSQMRFTGHLDLHRTWERTMRRARLPLAYSQGFNPHPHINLASALPLGFTGEAEIVDIWLEQDDPLDKVTAALHRAAPPGIQIQQVDVIDERKPALQTELEASEYIITFLYPQPGMGERVAALLAAERLARERRGKPYDLRPLILDLQLMPQQEGTTQQDSPPYSTGQVSLFARLAAREGATGRPEEVIAALDADPNQTRVHRVRLIFRSDPVMDQTTNPG